MRVLTDEGLIGLGEAFAYGGPLAVCNVIDDTLNPLSWGQDPPRVEALVDLMHRGTMIYGSAAASPCSRSAASRSRSGTCWARPAARRSTSCSAG